MSDKIGPVALASPEKRGEYLNREADEEISKFLRAAYLRVERLLRTKERELHVLAAALLERETLTQQEIKQIVFGEPNPAAEYDAERPHDAGGLAVP